MKPGQRSLWLTLGTQRVAGHDADQVSFIVRRLVECTAALHAAGIVHADIKSRNVLRLAAAAAGRWEDVILCDLDASLPMHAPVSKEASKRPSTAYCAPEVARHLLADADAPTAAVSLDVWSIGL